MLDFLLHKEKDDAINLLKADHDKVKGLFKDFKDAKDAPRRKTRIVADTLKELRIHAVIEEKIFYPAVRPRMKKDIMNEANEEHHVAKLLIAELSVMTGAEEHYDAKYTVLAENIEHHIKEEEGAMFPQVRSLNIDMVTLGKKMIALKNDLLENGIPPSAEERLMAMVGATAFDSPALSVKPRKKSTSSKKTQSAGKIRSAALRSNTLKTIKRAKTSVK